jgi:alpha-L-fucosidase 2
LRFLNNSLLFCCVLAICCSSPDSDTQVLCRERNSNLKLWYDSPAEVWDEALPVGNGRLGAMVFGSVQSERIQLNEESLWAGTRINNNNPNALRYLDEIRELLITGKNDEASELAEKYLVGIPPDIRSYQTLGDLFIEFDIDENRISNYRRELNLQSGIAAVSFETESGKIRREVFASSPDNIIVVHMEGEVGAVINTKINLNRKQDATTINRSDNILEMTGQIIDEPSERRGPGGEHMRFVSILVARNEGGSLYAISDTLIAEEVKTLTIILTAATDYNRDILNFDRNIDPLLISRDIISSITDIPYGELKRRHIRDHRSFFDRVCINLAGEEFEDIPTDIRLQNVIDGGEDHHLVELYLQYGRYLLMGSSRYPGRLPANLQGIWNEHFDAPWESDYHVNINLQMNYWPAEVLNLAETKIPLIEFFDRIREPGRETASEMYGAGGWAMHHLTDVFGRTGLMNAIMWGTFPLGGSCMCLPFWGHYEFNLDKEYLAGRIYPIMKEAAEFVLDFLFEDREGRLVTAPSYSPENLFIFIRDGMEMDMRLTYAPTMDIQIINEFFNACIRAAEIVGDDSEFVSKLRETLSRLPEVKIGSDGTIMEWIEDYREAEPGHRHISHLFGLHPGSQITSDAPALFEAAQKTIEKRLEYGGAHTGWSRAWIINMYARLFNSEEAYTHLQELFRHSTLKNLFDTHPPFQIDGNFGGSAGIAEMFLQSHDGTLSILPALPYSWDQGYIKGMRARGNFEVDIFWGDRELEQLIIKSNSGMPLKIRYRNQYIEIDTEPGEVYRFGGEFNGSEN